VLRHERYQRSFSTTVGIILHMEAAGGTTAEAIRVIMPEVPRPVCVRLAVNPDRASSLCHDGGDLLAALRA
jgi:hypothetical protein